MLIRKQIQLSLVALSLLVQAAGVLGQSSEKRTHRITPIAPMSQDVEILYGDPDKVGEPFVMRIRELPGGVIPPHRHPVDEHITVVQGTVYFGVGDKFDYAAMKELKVGSYAFIPKGSTMFGYTPEAAIVQVHGIGPFHIHWRAGNEWRNSLKTLDDPATASGFKFKKGERVVAKRGRGRVRQGYDSGEVIGYEIETEDGSLFMALEEELQLEGNKRKCLSNYSRKIGAEASIVTR
jgi:quercetin dioxygenase-like cupin family protein